MANNKILSKKVKVRISNMDGVKSSRNWKRVFWTVIATAIFGTLIYFADSRDVYEALIAANPLYVVTAVVLGFLGMMIWAFNWKNFFEISGIKESYPRTFQLMAASGFLNLVTPLGQFGGQPVMAYLVSKESDSSYEKALATLSSADLIAIMPVAVFSSIGLTHLLLTGGFTPEITSMSILVYSLSLFGIFMGYLGWYRPKILKNILFSFFSKIDYFTGKGSNLVDKIDQFLTTLEDSYRNIGKKPGKIIKSMFIVHFAYIAKFLALYAVMVSLGVSVNFFEIMLMVSLVVVANFSPTPGSTGTFEAAMTGLILLFVDISLATAVSAAILYRLSTYWVGVGVGYMALLSLGMNTEFYKEKADYSIK